MTEEKRLTFMGHLRELRSRLMKSAIAFLIAMMIAFFFTNPVFDILKKPIPGVQLIYTEVTEMIGTYIKVTLFIAVVIVLPYLAYQIVMFIRPALTRKERGYLYTMLPAITFSFMVGALFAYFVLVPPAFNFLLTFGNEIAQPMIKVGNYISVLVTLLFWIGICFEIPIIIFFLAKIGIVKAQWLSKYRKVFYILAFLLGAIITPTFDPVNQSLVAIPVIILFELGILLARIARRKKTIIA